jgi:chromosome segregation ATPase
LPGRGLIRPEATLTTLQKLQEDTAALRASLKEMDKAARENTKEREDLRRRLQDADEAADAARKKETQGLRRDLEDVDTRLKAQAGQMASLLEGQEAWRHKQDLRLNSLEEFRADFEDKKERLAGMADLMAAMKKDLNDDSQEIAQLKSQVEALNQKAFRPPEDDNLLLQAARWPYTPLVAVAISVVTMITLTVHK